MSLVFKVRKIDAVALAPFAEVLVSADGAARAVPAVMDKSGVPGAHVFFILCPRPVEGPLQIGTLERHPYSTQSFVPLKAGRWLILVAPKTENGDPNLAGALAFIAGPEDAICIRRDVWHAGLTVLDQAAQFGMIMWKSDSGEDGVVFDLDEPIEIAL